MSGAFPTSPGHSGVEIVSNQPTVVSMSASGKYQSRMVSAHLWELRIDFPPMTRDVMMPIFAFAMKQKGRAESFTIIPDNTATPRGTATGTPLANGAFAAGLTAIEVDGWTAGVTNIMRAGDVIKFLSHTKVYMVTDDCNSQTTDEMLLEDSSVDKLILEDSATDLLILQDANAATLNIQPPLITAVADNEAVTVSSVPFTVIFKNDIQSFKTSNPSISKYEIDLTEAIA